MAKFMKTLKDNRLEELSDKIRQGIPVGMGEAIEVIEYQQMLRNNKVTLKDKIINFFKIK